jgi:hypothetical protein
MCVEEGAFTVSRPLTCLPLKQIRCAVGVLRGARDEPLKRANCAAKAVGERGWMPCQALHVRYSHTHTPARVNACGRWHRKVCSHKCTHVLSLAWSDLGTPFRSTQGKQRLTKGWSFLQAFRSDASRPVAIPAIAPQVTVSCSLSLSPSLLNVVLLELVVNVFKYKRVFLTFKTVKSHLSADGR